VEAIKTVD